jgi:hypothetical protein
VPLSFDLSGSPVLWRHRAFAFQMLSNLMRTDAGCLSFRRCADSGEGNYRYVHSHRTKVCLLAQTIENRQYLRLGCDAGFPDFFDVHHVLLFLSEHKWPANTGAEVRCSLKRTPQAVRR